MKKMKKPWTDTHISSSSWETNGNAFRFFDYVVSLCCTSTTTNTSRVSDERNEKRFEIVLP